MLAVHWVNDSAIHYQRNRKMIADLVSKQNETMIPSMRRREFDGNLMDTHPKSLET